MHYVITTYHLNPIAIVCFTVSLEAYMRDQFGHDEPSNWEKLYWMDCLKNTLIFACLYCFGCISLPLCHRNWYILLCDGVICIVNIAEKGYLYKLSVSKSDDVKILQVALKMKCVTVDSNPLLRSLKEKQNRGHDLTFLSHSSLHIKEDGSLLHFNLWKWNNHTAIIAVAYFIIVCPFADSSSVIKEAPHRVKNTLEPSSMALIPVWNSSYYSYTSKTLLRLCAAIMKWSHSAKLLRQ